MKWNVTINYYRSGRVERSLNWLDENSVRWSLHAIECLTWIVNLMCLSKSIKHQVGKKMTKYQSHRWIYSKMFLCNKKEQINNQIWKIFLKIAVESPCRITFFDADRISFFSSGFFSFRKCLEINLDSSFQWENSFALNRHSIY